MRHPGGVAVPAGGQR